MVENFEFKSKRTKEQLDNVTMETKVGKIPCSIVRRSRETYVEIDYDHVAPESPGTVAVVIKILAKGDFSHHVIEDAMISLNELAEQKGIRHRLI